VFLDALAQRAAALGLPFRGLLLSDALTWLSLMVGYVAVPWWIATQGGAHDLAVYGLSSSAVSFISAPALSPLGDRLPKRRLIRLGLALQMAVAALLASLISLDLYALSWVLLTGGISAVAMAVLLPATLTIAAELVPAADLPRALSLQRSAQAIGRVAGPALGGAALSLGTGVALWLQLGLLLAAFMVARSLPLTRPAAAAGVQGWRRWRGELQQGLRAAWRMPLERGWMLVNFAGWIFMFPALTLLVPLKVKDLGLSGVWLGGAEAGLSLGMLAGALGGAAVVTRLWGRYATRIAATAAQGLGLALAGWSDNGPLLVAALFFVGFANSCGVLVGQTHRLLAIPQAFRARLSAVGMMSSQISATLGPALAGLALLHASVSVVYIAFGLLAGASALGYLLVPDFKTLLNLDHESVQGWYGRKHPELFGPDVTPEDRA